MELEQLKYLVCPTCQQQLRYSRCDHSRKTDNHNSLVCEDCGTGYPVINNIPRLFVDDSNDAYYYCKMYEYQWLKIDWHQPELTHRRFYELTGWHAGDIQGKTVLDAGCGGGRWCFQFARESAAHVVGLDYTLAIEKAQEVCRDYPQIEYVQGDIYHMPVADSSFDIVHCHGVLHNLPEPFLGLQHLSRKVKPGGELAFLVYRNLSLPQKIVDSAICSITRRIPIRIMYYVSIMITAIEYIPGAVWLLENIFMLSGQPGFSRKLLHNFDWYTSRYRHRISPDTAKKWLIEMGFGEIKILNTNEFRTRSRYPMIQKMKNKLLEKGFFLKATLGIRATRLIDPEKTIQFDGLDKYN